MRGLMSGTIDVKNSLKKLLKALPWAAGAAFLVYRICIYSPDPWQPNDYVNLLFGSMLAGALLVTGITLQRRAGNRLQE